MLPILVELAAVLSRVAPFLFEGTTVGGAAALEATVAAEGVGAAASAVTPSLWARLAEGTATATSFVGLGELMLEAWEVVTGKDDEDEDLSLVDYVSDTLRGATRFTAEKPAPAEAADDIVTVVNVYSVLARLMGYKAALGGPIQYIGYKALLEPAAQQAFFRAATAAGLVDPSIFGAPRNTTEGTVEGGEGSGSKTFKQTGKPKFQDEAGIFGGAPGRGGLVARERLAGRDPEELREQITGVPAEERRKRRSADSLSYRILRRRLYDAGSAGMVQAFANIVIILVENDVLSEDVVANEQGWRTLQALAEGLEV